MSGSAPQRIQLGPVPESVSVAREFVRRHAQDRADQCDVAVLLVSELVTNAVVHAVGEVEVEVDVNDNALRVAVRDGAANRLPAPRPRSLISDHGRGLWLLSLLSSGWGFDADQSGKVTWFELTRPG